MKKHKRRKKKRNSKRKQSSSNKVDCLILTLTGFKKAWIIKVFVFLIKTLVETRYKEQRLSEEQRKELMVNFLRLTSVIQ